VVKYNVIVGNKVLELDTLWDARVAVKALRKLAGIDPVVTVEDHELAEEWFEEG
jgi:hypothetical protein